MKKFLNVLRFESFGADSVVYAFGLTSMYDTDNINDRGYTLYFEQLGYTSHFALRNLMFIVMILAIQAVLIGITGLIELNTLRTEEGRMKHEIQMSTPSFAKNGRVKSYHATWF